MGKRRVRQIGSLFFQSFLDAPTANRLQPVKVARSGPTFDDRVSVSCKCIHCGLWFSQISAGLPPECPVSRPGQPVPCFFLVKKDRSVVVRMVWLECTTRR